MQQEVLVQNKNELSFVYMDFVVYLDRQVLELKPRIDVHSFLPSFIQYSYLLRIQR